MNNYVISYPEFLIESLGAIYRTDPGTNSIFYVKNVTNRIVDFLIIFYMYLASYGDVFLLYYF